VSEQSKAANIKSKTTRKAVQQALTKIKGFLSKLRVLPENGLAVFSSNCDFVAITPDFPLSRSNYVCEKTFCVQAVVECFPHENQPMFAWAHLTGSELTYQETNEKTPRRFQRAGGKPHRHNKGGQSAPRFQRLFNAADEAWAKEGAVWLCKQFDASIQHLFVGGPGQPKKLLKGYLPVDLPCTFVVTDGDGARFSRHVRQVLVPEFLLEQTQKHVRTCSELVVALPDKTTVGARETLEHKDLLSHVWVEEQHQHHFDATPQTLLPNNSLSLYGGVVGELFYPLRREWENEQF
jgi:hypothetical protein